MPAFINPALAIVVDYVYVQPEHVRVLHSFPGFTMDELRRPGVRPGCDGRRF